MRSPSYRLQPASYWKSLCRAPRARLLEIQAAALRRFVREELYPFSAYYRRVFDAAGLSPRDVRGPESLRRLPFTTKADLLAAQTDPEHRYDFVLRPTPHSIKAHWPFSRKLALVLGGAAARESLRRSYTPNFLTFTTGRSSEPVAFTYTPFDIDLLGEVGARMLEVAGISDPSWRVLNMFPFAPHLAFWQVTLAGFSTGQMVVPTGGGKVLGTAGNLRSIDRLKPNVLVATPGYLYHVLREGREQGLDTSAVRLVILGAEKVPPGMKHKMAEVLEQGGARDVEITGTYGFTEARMAFGECPTPYEESSGYHLYPDLGLFEIIDPESGEPVAEGESGEIVYTGLAGHGTAVCRYRTGDMAMAGITWGPCPHCGRTLPRLGSELRRVSERRALELTKIKGTLVDLSHIGTIVSSHPDVDEWQVVLRKKDDDPLELDELVLRLALKEGADRERVVKELERDIRTATEIAPSAIEFPTRAELLESLGMETEMKEKRYLDLRPK